MTTKKGLRGLDVEATAKAIEADAGESLAGLREALAEAKAGKFAATHTPEQIAARKPGRPLGSTKADAKVSTTIRFDQDVLAALKSTGPGWQSRANELLRGCLLPTKVHG